MTTSFVGKLVRYVGIIIIILIFLLVSYFTVVRALDANVCIPRVSKNLGIKPDQSELYEYVRKELIPGLSKSDVINRLERIGPTKILGTTELANGTIREGVEIRICLHPLNNILIITSYSQDWILLGSYVQEDSP